MFNFLKENKILVVIKTKLLDVIADFEEPLKEMVINYINNKTPEYKTLIIGFIMSKIELPWYLKMFKGRVEKTISKNIDKLIAFIQIKITEL